MSLSTTGAQIVRRRNSKKLNAFIPRILLSRKPVSNVNPGLSTCLHKSLAGKGLTLPFVAVCGRV